MFNKNLTFPDNNALSVSSTTFSRMVSTAPKRDSWWLGHVEPDDVVIADIAGQAPDILLHGRQSALKNSIIKTFTHTCIPTRPCTLLKNAKKQQQQNAQLTEYYAFVYWSSSCPVCWWATFRKLGTCSTSEVLSPRTVLTENICESVQQILPHSPAQNRIVELTKHDAFLYWSSSCPMWWWATARKLGSCCSGLFHVGGPLA